MKDKSTKPQGKSKYAARRSMSIEATHDLHTPRVFYCRKCNPAYQRPAQADNE